MNDSQRSLFYAELDHIAQLPESVQPIALKVFEEEWAVKEQTARYLLQIQTLDMTVKQLERQIKDWQRFRATYLWARNTSYTLLFVAFLCGVIVGALFFR